MPLRVENVSDAIDTGILFTKMIKFRIEKTQHVVTKFIEVALVSLAIMCIFEAR
jgi:hypothetical protein